MTCYTNGHSKDCDYHLDQYPHECTCGVSVPIAEEVMHAAEADLANNILPSGRKSS